MNRPGALVVTDSSSSAIFRHGIRRLAHPFDSTSEH